MMRNANSYWKRNIIIILLTEAVALGLIWVVLEVNIPYQKLWLATIFMFQAGLVYMLLRNMSHQAWKIEDSLEKLADGKLKSAIAAPQGMANTALQHINRLYTQMKEATFFIEKIGSRQMEDQMQAKLLHLSTSDQLGNALINMSAKMQAYQDEEEKRNWSAEGLASFAEILRTNTDDLEIFCNQVMRQLVKYLKCNQGSFFIQNEDAENETFLELIACFAYDKRKYQEKKIKLGQGLIGQCAFEKQMISVTDIPQNYVHITSGLGEATPNHLVIVPLMINDEFHGAIELASFKKLEAYQLAFLEKAAESIASTLDTVKVTLQTKLLLERSHKLTTELRSREEEMRHHLETLTAAQQEMEMKQNELQWVFQAMDNSLLTATFDLHGQILSANDKLSTLSGYTLEEMYGKGKDLVVHEKDGPFFWEDIHKGEVKSGEFKIMTNKSEERWINASFTPMQAEGSHQKKVLMLGNDITEKKLVLEKLSLVANNTDNSVVITNTHGYIEFVNEGFVKLTGYSKEEVLGRNPGKVLQGPRTDQNTVKRIRKKIKQRVPFYEEILNYRKDGSSYWISLMINPVKNDEGQTIKYISIQTNVSEIKEATLEHTYKLEAIGRSNAIIEFDVQGEIIEVNPIFLSVSGYDKEELIGKPYEYLLPESEKDKPQVQMMWDNLKEGTFFSGEFIQKSKEGKDLWLNGTFNPIFDLEENLQKILMFAQFTTYEKEKQNELSGILNALNSSVMTLEMDVNGSLKKGNALFLQAFGYKRSEIARKNISDILKEAAHIPEILERLKTESSVTYSLILITKEKEEKNYLVTFNAIQNLGHQLYRVVAILNER